MSATMPQHTNPQLNIALENSDSEDDFPSYDAMHEPVAASQREFPNLPHADAINEENISLLIIKMNDIIVRKSIDHV